MELALIAEPLALGDVRERRGQAAKVERAFTLDNITPVSTRHDHRK